MLGRLRRRLRMIEYYSAARPRTVWSRAMDAALIGSFFLALPATWICDVMFSRGVSAIDLSGQVFRLSNGSTAVVMLDSPLARIPPQYGVAVGTFRIEVIDMLHGWPLTTTVRRQPARVDIDLREEAKPRLNAQLAMDDPLRLAAAAALESDGRLEALAAWQPPATNDVAALGTVEARKAIHVRRSLIDWTLATGIWWIALMFSSAAIIQVAKFFTLLAQDKRRIRRARLRAEGKCHVCGYDMTGLEFNERCPECGTLVW